MRPCLSVIPLLATVTIIWCATPLRARAQIVPDNTLGSENSVVSPNVNLRGIDSNRIDGGAVRGNNLFHSFQEFNIEEGRGAYFSNPDNIVNILTRVTGNNISNILGTLGVLGNANLFLINPNGIVFGPNARLDVGGSFFASTADEILFENGVEFAASNPEAPPLLTINIPLGLNFRENPGNIVNQSIAVDSEDNFVGLQVLPQKTLGFVGGDIQLEGGILTAPQGRIELGSVAGNSQGSLTQIDKGYALTYENVPNFQDIALSQGALIDVRGEGGGDIQVQGRRITLTDGSIIEASTEGSEPGGVVSIQASESVEVFGGGIFADVDPGATAIGGSLIINTQNLLVQDGASISVSTFGNGDAGDLMITANDIEIVGTAAEAVSSIGVSVQPGAVGNGGILTINTQRLLVQDGAQINVATFSRGNGGNLTITTTDMEVVSDSVVGNSVQPGATGNAGTLTIDTQNLRVQDGGQISAATNGQGDGGNLTITANTIELIGALSYLFTSVEPGAVGNAGTLTIDTQRLLVQDGAQISTATNGQGDGGNLTINATDVELIGTNADGQLPSGLFTSVDNGATGDGGILTLNTQRLTVRDGAQITTTTFVNGDAGDLIVNATDIELIGTSADGQTASGLFADVEPESTGQGGELRVNANNLTIQDGARIDVRSEGTEAAGDLIINAPNILLDNQATLNANTTAGEGDIILNTEDLRLRNNSSITTNATGQATGGNIEISTNNLIAIENSDISANAEDAFGGQVIINADALFGTQFRSQQTNASDITATSERGPDFSGTVEINNEIDPARGLVDLSTTVVDPAALIAQDPCKLRGDSEFIITGRGGIASSPNDTFTGDRPQVSLVEPVRSSPNPSTSTSTQASRTEPNQPRSSAAPRLRSGLNIIPARGWIRDQNGDVILVSYDPTKTGVQRQQHNPHSCQPYNTSF